MSRRTSIENVFWYLTPILSLTSLKSMLIGLDDGEKLTFTVFVCVCGGGGEGWGRGGAY